MLNFIYYPVSFILWCWHWVFGHIFGESSGFAWALAVVFLVFTLRAILFKPFVGQVRSMRKMQEFAPEMQKIKKKYAERPAAPGAGDAEAPVASTGSTRSAAACRCCVQIPVFIGLFHVLRSFRPGWGEVYFFDAQGRRLVRQRQAVRREPVDLHHDARRPSSPQFAHQPRRR